MEKVVSRKSHKLQIVGSTPTPATNKEENMNKKQQEQEAADKAVAEFLANGGTITQCVYGVSGRVEGESYNPWSKKKPSTSPLANPPEDDE
jgi:hypothetical protein